MAKDPYKYFRIEGRELVDALKQGALDLEKDAASKELVARLLRLAHTLKGAARVVKLPAIAEHAHSLEEVLEPHRSGGAVARETVDELLRLVDAMSVALAALDSAGESAPVDEPRNVETVRIEIDDMDKLLGGLVEATVQLNAVRRALSTIERAHRVATALADQFDRGRDTEATRGQRQAAAQLRADLTALKDALPPSIEQVGIELLQARDAASRLRLTPVAGIFATLERVARDAGRALGKAVRFESSGGETRLDAHVLAAVTDALVQIVRNAVAHGIETTGVVELRVERRGNTVAFVCSDDGRGVDVAALRRAAVARGALGEHATEAELFELLLRGGLTTSRAVTEMSGRGVGLDVVRAVASRLGGTVSLRTKQGAGTTFEICVPISLTSQHALGVVAGGLSGSLPLDAVRGTLRVQSTDIARSASGDALVYEGEVIPFAPLARVLRRRDSTTRRRTAWPTVVLQSGTRRAAIGVDELRGTSEIVVRALPPDLDADAVVGGASLDAEGNPELVFDAAGIVDAVGETRDPEPAHESPRPPLLVIDDSLTTRMLEQSILESAGYDVDVATSAEEALEKAKTTRYGVFVVDVEMPGMNGFEFVARTRADATLRDVPAILLTSRGSDEDKRRGMDAGARAYVVKGEFDQAILLRTIRELLG